MNSYKATIGIEVHAEVNTKSKMFCGCKNDPHAAAVNTNICPVCLAHPGTLPVVNKEAVEKILMVGKAIGGEIADYSEFDRKQYFYPDIPKAYQLSQYAFPFVKGGSLGGVAITRVHLEEDTARSQHDIETLNAKANANEGLKGDSLVDFNRAGVPLMELVTEPVIHDSKTAAKFTKELQLLLRTLGVSEANMEKGEMRVEANISVSDSDKLGTKVEVKNLNSFKAMEQAIDYEISRQSEILAKNGSISQETRGWDENKSKTFVQRSKESAMDYRYFPDPDIPKFSIGLVAEFSHDNLRGKMPLLPEDLRKRLLGLGLSQEQAEALLYDKEAKEYFFEAFPIEGEAKDGNLAKLFANYLLSDLAGMRAARPELSLSKESAERMKALMLMLIDDQVSSRAAKDMLEEVVFEGAVPSDLAKNRGLLQNNSAEFLDGIVKEVIDANPAVAEEVRGGKLSAVQFLVGQGMKASKGSADPKALMEAFQKHLQP
jgi:aspartyl-tRNA(Asn)/glutamyl-tRNA(Gln) amidotransferase subunit B